MPTFKREEVISKAHPDNAGYYCARALYIGLRTTPTCIMYIRTVYKQQDIIAVVIRYFPTITNSDISTS